MPRTNVGASQPEMNTEEPYSFSSLVNMEYRQVGGLMLWLCFFMVVINPLEGAFEIWRDLVRTNGFSTQPVALLGQLLAYTAQAVLVIGGIVAGILLWQLHRKGVLLMKLWFVVYFSFVLLLTF